MKNYTEKEIEELAVKAGEIAQEDFMAGMNCAEAVLSAILKMELSDLPYETVMVASGLGGGVGGSGSICGAINGGALAIGAMRGRKNPTAAGDAKACKQELHDKEHGLYLYLAEYMNELKSKTGSVDCHDLTKTFDMSNAEHRKARLFTCKNLVKMAAEQAIRTGLKQI